MTDFYKREGIIANYPITDEVVARANKARADLHYEENSNLGITRLVQAIKEANENERFARYKGTGQ